MPLIAPSVSRTFCWACSRIDLVGALQGRAGSPRNFSILVKAGSESSMQYADFCILCHFLKSIIPPEKINRTIDLELVSVAKQRGVQPYLIQQKKKSVLTDIYLLKVVQASSNTRYPRYLGFAAAEPDAYTYLRLLEPSCFNLKWVRHCMNFCDLNHGKICRPDGDRIIKSFVVYNCQTKKRCDAPLKCQYAALSYPWGDNAASSEEQDDTEHEDLSSINLPASIEDSFIVCLQLGIQYLWVDRYAIPKINKEDKHYQLRHMDSIYSGACLTIIAACGIAASGLTGVRNRLRSSQPTVAIGGHIIAAALPNVRSEVMEQSEWGTRGWVVQENLLSRRRLIFTRSQVAFECNCMHTNESVNEPLVDMHTKNGKHMIGSVSGGAALNTGDAGSLFTSPISIFKYIQEYNQKHLSRPSDALDGFQGIFRVFTKQKLPVYHLGGIPIFRDRPHPKSWHRSALESWHNSLPTTCLGRFLYCLAWRMEQHGVRRPGFPTWSWTGTQGRLFWIERGTPKETTVRLESSNGEVLDFPDFATLPSISEKFGDDLRYLQVECWAAECSLMLRKNHIGYSSISSAIPRHGPYEYIVAINIQNIATCYYTVWLDRHPNTISTTAQAQRTFQSLSFFGKTINDLILVENMSDHVIRLGSLEDCLLTGQIEISAPLLTQMQNPARAGKMFGLDPDLLKSLEIAYRHYYRNGQQEKMGGLVVVREERMYAWRELLCPSMKRVQVRIG